MKSNQNTSISSEFRTLEYKMSVGHFASEMLFRHAGKWMLTLTLVSVAALVVGITIDIRWFIVGLMFVLVVIPMVLMFLFYYFGLRRESFVNTVPHVLEITDGGIEIEMRFPGDDEDSEPKLRRESFAFSEMLPIRFGLKSATVPLKHPSGSFIWIPADAFEDSDDVARALETIDNRIAAVRNN